MIRAILSRLLEYIGQAQFEEWEAEAILETIRERSDA